MYQNYLTGMDLTGAGATLLWAVAGLILLAAALSAGWYEIQNHTVRVYNWDGKRYRYLGRTGLYREKGRYSVHIGERMADLSCTTLYRICPAKRFVRRNRYRELVLYAGAERCMLHVDDCMRESVYYRRAP